MHVVGSCARSASAVGARGRQRSERPRTNGALVHVGQLTKLRRTCARWASSWKPMSRFSRRLARRERFAWPRAARNGGRSISRRKPNSFSSERRRPADGGKRSPRKHLISRSRRRAQNLRPRSNEGGLHWETFRGRAPYRAQNLRGSQKRLSRPFDDDESLGGWSRSHVWRRFQAPPMRSMFTQ